MISGDHIETAKRVAYKAGILTDEDMQKQNCVLDAEDFRNMVGIFEEITVELPDGSKETKLALEH
jgi:magnesium-transporting ATPase (P-type)